MLNPRTALGAAVLAACAAAVTVPGAAAAHDAFIPRLVNTSTIPSNGDLNPYGVAFVPEGFPAGGLIAAGDVLVANFNAATNNFQGTGTTIIQFRPSGDVAPPGTATTFFTSGLKGLDTAIGALRAGFVIVGNLPTTDGTAATVGQGALQILDRHGKVVATWTDRVLLDGPWDLAIDDHGAWARIFVSNVLNGTVARFDVAVDETILKVTKQTLVASDYRHVPNAAAVVLGPTGLAFDEETDTLYVASTADNAIYAVAHAGHASGSSGRGRLVFANAQLRGPLALRWAPNGHLLTANGDAVNSDPQHPSEIVEFTKSGRFVREFNVDASQGGAFGFDTRLSKGPAYDFAVIDDVTNSLAVYHLRGEEDDREE